MAGGLLQTAAMIMHMPALRLPLRAALALSVSMAAIPLHGSDHPKKYAGLWKGETYGKGETRADTREGAFAARHHTIELSLGPDGTATVTQSPDAVSETTGFAHWNVSGDQLMLVFDVAAAANPAVPEPNQTSQPTPPLTFAISHGELTPIAWDHSLWKAQGPPKLHRP